jgi:hypothetical protein
MMYVVVVVVVVVLVLWYVQVDCELVMYAEKYVMTENQF